MSKKRKYGDAWKEATADSTEVEQMDAIFDRFIASTIRPALVEDEKAKQVISPLPMPSSPVSSPASSPISSPAPPPASTPISSPGSSPVSHIEPTLDATHTASERSVYSVLYRLTISQGKNECHITNSELRQLTGIGSHNTVREAIKGLLAKASVGRIGGKDCSHFGPRYRVYKPREIMTRRRQIGIEIDLQSKKIISSPGSSPGSSPKIGRGSSPKIGDEEASLLLNDLNLKNHDDDRARDLHKVLNSIFPNIDLKEIEQACSEIDSLIATELVKRASHATTPPVSPRYLVECVRRLCSESQRGDQIKATAPKGTTARNARKRKMQMLAAQLKSVHTGGNYSLADFSDDLKRACAREGIDYDNDLINEVIGCQ